MYKVMRSFMCRGCSNPVISTGHTNVDIGASPNLEVVDKFCYLGGEAVAVPTTVVPTTAVPTIAIPTTVIPTTGQWA